MAVQKPKTFPIVAVALLIATVATCPAAAERSGLSSRHWALEKPRRPAPPEISNPPGQLRSAIDSFVATKLQKENLRMSPEADRWALVRRLSLDLTGLPPTVEEVDAFVQDEREGAYERLVDRLLASPHYGEKMAQDWLDLARFGDTSGYQDDALRPAWPYRDHVIDAFNRNQPFDQFTIEQLAGDLLPSASVSQRIASGFNRLHRHNEEGGSDPDEFLVVYAVDRTNTVGTVWLGLTVGCAQCHDHKHDPISQREYYQLYAYFNSLKDEVALTKAPHPPPQIELPSAVQEAELVRLDAEIAPLDEQWNASQPQRDAAYSRWLAAPASGVEPKIDELRKLPQRTEDQAKELREHFDANFASEDEKQLRTSLRSLQSQRAEVDKAIPRAPIWQELSPRRPAFVLTRGEFDQRGEEVQPGVPREFPPLSKGRTNDRLALARWLVSSEHPLTARVTVNRLWKQFFGVGLVKTAGDFGTQGEPPSHPELLDWLAIQLIEDGWDLKKFQKRIVMSSTYRQSSKAPAELYRRDPENRLLARGSRFRVTAEEIRDGALAASGLLNPKIGGASVHPYQPAGYFGDKSVDWNWPDASGESLYRRGLYTFWRRTTLYPSLQAFDAPTRGECTVSRPRTNTPLQALVTLNDPVFVEAARVLGERIVAESGESDGERIRFAARWVLAREPSADESQALARLVTNRRQRYTADPVAAATVVAQGKAPRRADVNDAELAVWMSVASVLLNLDETITRE